jgi:Fic family protein
MDNVGDIRMNLELARMKRAAVPMGTGWLLAECMEARGKQDLWTNQKPEVLAALREQAIVQSVESSNRIEGVTVDPERLRPVVLGGVRPRTRPEEELAGYRKALDWIFTRKAPVEATPRLVLHLHATAQGGLTGDAGKWKSRDNEIIEFDQGGNRRIRFVPVPAKAAPGAVEKLCRHYAEVREDGSIPGLLAIATFVVDFLCIHPFRDGNGRVSRLLTTALLQADGFAVGRYVSLERIVEESKEEYYRVLESSSRGWHEGKNDIEPWWNYFLGMLRKAYGEFGEMVKTAPARGGKTGMVRAAVLAQPAAFTLAELRQGLPSISTPMIKKVLGDMKREGLARSRGHGRSAVWEVRGKGK